MGGATNPSAESESAAINATLEKRRPPIDVDDAILVVVCFDSPPLVLSEATEEMHEHD